MSGVFHFTKIGVITRVVAKTSWDYVVKITNVYEEVDGERPNDLEDIITFEKIFSNREEAEKFMNSKMVQKIYKMYLKEFLSEQQKPKF